MTDGIDFDRLSESNKLIAKWINRLGLEQRDCYLFVKKCKNNDWSFDLDSFEMSQLQDDAKIFSYTAEIENDIIKQFMPMIYAVARRLKCDVDDDCFSKGLTAIRKAVYYFNGKCKFTTFCYNGISTAYRQVFDAITKVQKNTVFATDLESKKWNSYTFDVGVESQESPVNKLLYIQQNIDDISSIANLNDLEKNALSARIHECLGEDNDWLMDFYKRTGLTLSKSKVYQIFRSAAKKVRNSVDCI